MPSLVLLLLRVLRNFSLLPFKMPLKRILLLLSLLQEDAEDLFSDFKPKRLLKCSSMCTERRNHLKRL